MKLIVSGASVSVWMVSALFGQAPPAPGGASKLEFEVASVKEAAPMMGGMMRIGMNVDAGRMDYRNVALKDCIRTAYRLKDFQISGPDWLANTRFDIIAKLPEGATKEQVPEMLQALLAERFKLTVHHESKSHDSYAMVVGKGGAKLTPSAPDDPASGPAGDTTVKIGGPGGGGGGGRAEGQRTMVFSSSGGGGGGGGGMAMVGGDMGAGGTMKMQLKKLTLTGFAEVLGRFLGSPVADLTEIQGNYDFVLEVGLEDLTRGSGLMIMKGSAAGGDARNPAGNSEAADPGGAIFRTVQNYGLKLDKRKAPMDLLVIDHIEKVPTEN